MAEGKKIVESGKPKENTREKERRKGAAGEGNTGSHGSGISGAGEGVRCVFPYLIKVKKG